MQLLLVLLGLCYLVSAGQETEIQQKFSDFKTLFGRKYSSVKEHSQAFVNFRRNVQLIWQHNKRFDQGLESYEMSVNNLSDMDFEEIQNSYMGLKITEKDKDIFRNASLYQTTEKLHKLRPLLPAYVDWRESGSISPVKNQKRCGSCWAFASVAALEAHYFIKYKQRIALSEQNLVDCVEESWGCSGGWMVPAFKYVVNNPGINSEDTYPYEAIDAECRYQPNPAAINKGYLVTIPGIEQHMKLTVALVGPVAVAIHVNGNFLNYKSGVFNDPDCSKLANHAVLVVGYGTENGKDYWLIKNSWGTQWGDQGYIKMARNKNNQCAIASYVSYPVF